MLLNKHMPFTYQKMGRKQGRYHFLCYIQEASSTLSTNNRKKQIYMTSRAKISKPFCEALFYLHYMETNFSKGFRNRLALNLCVGASVRIAE
jgi:hypothetical protein